MLHHVIVWDSPFQLSFAHQFAFLRGRLLGGIANHPCTLKTSRVVVLPVLIRSVFSKDSTNYGVALTATETHQSTDVRRSHNLSPNVLNPQGKKVAFSCFIETFTFSRLPTIT